MNIIDFMVNGLSVQAKWHHFNFDIVILEQMTSLLYPTECEELIAEFQELKAENG